MMRLFLFLADLTWQLVKPILAAPDPATTAAEGSHALHFRCRNFHCLPRRHLCGPTARSGRDAFRQSYVSEIWNEETGPSTTVASGCFCLFRRNAAGNLQIAADRKCSVAGRGHQPPKHCRNEVELKARQSYPAMLGGPRVPSPDAVTAWIVVSLSG